MGVCPEIVEVDGPCVDVEMPPLQDIETCCGIGTPEPPEPPTPVIGIESGATNICYLVDGAVVSYLVEVVRPDTDAPASGPAQIFYHNTADGTTVEEPPGMQVDCNLCIAAACLDVDGTPTYGQVTYVLTGDGAQTIISTIVDGNPVEAVIVDSGLCC